ncbi:UNVERIFIED_CONTAM: Retrovirus-related Pol polyprotein from type-1 retrotransposable element R2 [Sesamum calycinum]|uniref:Retrovirus-related Pol polyprotein from type-1 retrotransposable element R2 n=1 Tax=Sesamum calycinum TaxID=2727403 RepID=A0AAW2PPD8_9LAMI
MPPSLNETNIVLIPKCKNPINLTQFRPISLCNVVYKIASKTVANRLKLILDHIISPAQSAFVPHRLITDNILLAFELNHFLNTKTTGKQGYMAMKLDVSKAYDKVEWAFLEQVMAKLGFPSSFLRLIMLFVSSVSYSFMNGGQQFGSVFPRRGLRQGDSLSPYLFFLCTESFSSLLHKAEMDGRIRGVSICQDRTRSTGYRGNVFVIANSKVARYFPHGNIFEASLSRRLFIYLEESYGSTRHLRAGCRWRVGSGTSICIWKDPWLLRPLTFAPITPPLGHMSEMKVSDLIDPQTQDWNAQLIRSIFWPVDSDLILERPCSSTSMTAESDWWRKLWQLKLPSKIKVFPWRACLNALPTAANLNKRLKTESFSCPFCAASREDIIHTLLLCPFARQVIEFTENYLKSFKSQNSVTNIRLSSLNPQHWLCPPSATVKINCDGAVFEQGMEMGLGVIARDDQGRCLWWSSKRITRGGNGEIAEAMAVRHGLELGVRLGWSSIIIEIADSRTLAASFQLCSFNLVPRYCNTMAHVLAKSAVGSLEGISNLPTGAADLVLADISTS